MFLETVSRLARLRRCTRLTLTGLLLLALGGPTWMLADARDDARRRAEQALHSAIVALEGDIGRTIAQLDTALRTTVAGLGMAELGALTPRLRQAVLFDATPAVATTGILVTDAAGRLLHASHDGLPAELDVGDRPYFLAHRADPAAGLRIGAPLQDRATARWVLPLSRRVDTADGGFAGVAVAGLHLDHLRGLFAPLQLGEGGVVALLHRDGRLIVRSPDGDAAVGRPVPEAAVFERLRHAAGGTFEARSVLDGRTRLYAYRQVGDWPLVLGLGMDTGVVYAGWWRRLAVVGLLVAALLVGLAAGLAVALRRELARRSVAEGRALASASHLALLAENSQDLLVTLDREGVRRFVSSASRAMLGHAPEALLGRSALELAHPADRPRLHEALAAMRSGCSEAVTYRERHRDGGWRWLEAQGRGLPGGAGAILVARDVTERLRVEDRLRQSQRVEAVGRLTAGVAHDFNNLLTTLLGSLELLEDEVADRPAARELASTARAMGERGARLTHQLLSFSRQQVLRPRPVDLGALLTRLAETLGRTLGPQIAVRVEAAGAPAALVDPAHLEAALLNLALNARDAMPQGGLLRLEAGPAAAGVWQAGLPEIDPARHVVVAVVDQGVGMDPRTLDHACEPFFSTKGRQGTGLGLSMAQGFARQSGGDLRIVSRPGRGTRVELWLPIAAPAAVALPGEAAAPRLRGAGRVLLVDDVPDVLVTVGAFLESAGFAVVRETSAAAALGRLTAGEAFDALVTDHAMPGMRGGDLVLAAQARRPGMPALVITGFAEAEELARVAAQVAILRKPFRREELVRRLLEVMRPGAGAAGVVGERPRDGANAAACVGTAA